MKNYFYKISKITFLLFFGRKCIKLNYKIKKIIRLKFPPNQIILTKNLQSFIFKTWKNQKNLENKFYFYIGK